jgi:hypothetical protein
MIPFSLINVARFAQLMGEDRTWRERAHEIGLRLLGLLLTGMLAMASCYLCWTIMARQCGEPTCVPDFFLVKWFGQLAEDWQRYLFASLVPLAVILLLWLFGKQKIKYNSPGPMRSFDKWRKNGDIGDLGFWRGTHSIVQRIAHIWFAVSIYGVCALFELGPPPSRNPWPDALHVGYTVAATLLAVGLTVSVLYVMADPQPRLHRELTRDGSDTKAAREIEVRPDRFMQTLAWITMPAALGAAFLLIAGQRHATEHVETVVDAYDVLTTIFGGAAAVLLGFVFAMCVAQRTSAAGLRLRGFGPPVPETFRPLWNGFGPWVLASFSVMIGYGFAAAAPLLLAEAVGAPVGKNRGDFSGAAAPGVDGPHITIAEGLWKIAFLWGLLTMVLVVFVFPIVFYAVRRWLPSLALLVAGLAALVVLLLSDRFPVWLFAVLVLGAGAVAFVVSLRFPGRAFTKRVAVDYEDQQGSNVARVNQQQVARRWRIVLARYRYHHLLGWIALAGGLLVVISGLVAVAEAFVDLRPVAEFLRDSWAKPMISKSTEITALGVGALTALMGGLIALGISVWRKPKVRTQAGVLWDLLSFWPRMGHPLVPRPYGERAVIAMGERAVQLATLPLLDHSKADVVILSGHSQGAVICLAVCAVIDRQCGDDAAEPPTEMNRREAGHDWLGQDRAEQTIEKLRLLTYGSQLKFIYARLFPSYFGYARQRRVYTATLKRRWRNIYRWTDPLGGPVLSWPASGDELGPGPLTGGWKHMDSGAEDGPALPEKREISQTAGEFRLRYYWWETGPDIRVRDPETVVETPLCPMLPPKGHSSYPSAAVYDRIVDDLVNARTETPED